MSVLIPAYNHERFIVECLDSVAGSTHTRIELLIVDDGSGDETATRARDWLSSHADRFERAEVRSRPNVGICATLNELVAWSRGDFTCLLASDDALLPGGIADRVEFLTANPAYEAAVSDVVLIDDCGAVVAESALRAYGYRMSHLPTDRLLALFLCSWTPPFSHQFFRAEWLRQHPYPTRLGYEDYYTALLLSRSRQIALLPVVTTLYRVAVGRTQGDLPTAVLGATHVATLECVLGDRRRRPLVAAVLARARRTVAGEGSDRWTRALHLATIPMMLRYRNLRSLHPRLQTRPGTA